ncbi:unnamed protein product [Zymoseptoria tritici ST99CH_1A5]|uniref:SH3 domain-containing protein n=2 Tax=Zymoseptoria tritici TaxID=1047171 RepID=A0A2H1GK03_ZYMTR|nr:unnamed protein product [Zymoseptoria tritici ST99CH_1E4]SMY25316.1 unnamed protein product [Zymoseptoria tritici ST99CH_1A5]
MALHKRHTHGRVFRGEEARELLAIRKRENHADQPVMNIPEGQDLKPRQDNGVKVVYVTLPQTFSGPAYYLTLSSAPAPQPQATHTASFVKAAPLQGRPSSATAVASPVSSAVVSPKMPSTSSADLSDETSSASLSSIPTTMATSSRVSGTPLRSTATSTSSAAAEATDSSGMTAGGKAGLAFGIIFIIGAMAGCVYFFLWRKKKQTAKQNGEMIDEKRTSFPRAGSQPHGGMTAAAATGAFAAPVMRQMEEQPRQMDHGERAATKHDSIQTEKVPASVRSERTSSTAPRLSLRPITQLMFAGDRTSSGNKLESQPRENPFKDGAEKARSTSPPSNPFDGASPTAAGNASPQFAAGAVPMTAGGVPPSPRGPNNVHRVQLDFKPSMDDELELRSGQLVRMLHEYDDGWALCIRMDRSQQGVAPRTCLSKLPVKPRPQGPPGQQGSRPGTAQSNRSPPNAPGMMVPRPLTPNSNERPISPPMRSEMRPSPSENVAPPASVSVPARKPVPGQAM